MPNALAMAGSMLATTLTVSAAQVKWHPEADHSAVRVLHICRPAEANEFKTCHESVSVVPRGVSIFVAEHKLAKFAVVLADLNGDDRPEALIYPEATIGANNADLCGSGGCDLYVLTLSSDGYNQVGQVSVSQLPVRILSGMTKGWHDLSVRVVGGGITTSYEARLRFNGRNYPSNASVLPSMKTVDIKAVTAISNVPRVPY